MRFLKNKRGFTLIEVVVILAVIGILAAVLTPMIISYITDAQIRRAQGDVKTIGGSIQAFNKDLREWPIWLTGTATKPANTKFDVLSTEAGDDAAAKSGVTYDTATSLDSLDDQLVTNDPVYSLTAVRKWMGPYLENISEDPWGNKYYVNVKFLQPEFLSPGAQKAVFVLSAGPNELIETAFTQEENAFTVGGDDITFRIK